MTEYERLLAASVALSEKLDVVTEDSFGIFKSAAAHGVIYTGATYNVEHDELKAAIKDCE